MPRTRIASVTDAEQLATVLRANRAFLAAWEPERSESYFTPDGQRAALDQALGSYDRGGMVPLVILDDAGDVVGRISINNIVRGAFQSASLGYWVSQSHNGRGIASAAVADAITFAFWRLRLHRLEAGTLLHNTASQHVLTRNGFRPFAVAPSYIKIAGTWQDHILYQLLNPG
jgi:[ribosomal protein S5]-alanine N-acetyltransferase